MKKIWFKIQKFWYFKIANPVVCKGQRGGFKYVFRRFWLEISTLSGNWSMRVTANEHPYAYLLVGAQNGHENNVFGFAEMLYELNATLTTDQKLVNDVQKAIKRYEERLAKTELESADEEKAAIEEVKGVQEYVEKPKRLRRKYDREVDGRFKKAVKDAERKA